MARLWAGTTPPVNLVARVVVAWYKAPLMDKKQAAKFLGVSPRTLERYTTQKKLGVTYKQGKTAAEAVYDEAELRRFKDALENKTFPTRPAVEPPGEDMQALVASARDTGLTEAVGGFRNDLISALEALRPNSADSRSVPIADKIILTLAEASALTNLSRNHLRQAIEEKKLRARIIGRGWRVKREDLDAYVRKL